MEVTHLSLALDSLLVGSRVFDDDETGAVSFENLKRVAQELGENMTDEELTEMLHEIDRGAMNR